MCPLTSLLHRATVGVGEGSGSVWPPAVAARREGGSGRVSEPIGTAAREALGRGLARTLREGSGSFWGSVREAFREDRRG